MSEDKIRKLVAEDRTTLTTVEPITSDDLAMLRHFAWNAMSSLGGLQWRHNGQGMLQAYMYESPEVEGRIHIWHDDLRKPGIALNGLVHDHRFDMRSHVIFGAIEHREYTLCPVEREDDAGAAIMEVTNARKAKMSDKGKDYHMEPERVGGYYFPTYENFTIKDGVYDFPRFRFHRAVNVESPTVTIVLKSRQVDTKARLLDQFRDGPLINAFEDTMTEEEFRPTLSRAYNLLRYGKL